MRNARYHGERAQVFCLRVLQMSALTEERLFLILFLLLLAWLIYARPPRGLSPAEYRTWYRVRYLNSYYWRFYSRTRRRFSFGCAMRWRGGCSGYLQVHHRTWAYRYKFYEWLPWITLFGTVVLCDRHHKMIKV